MEKYILYANFISEFNQKLLDKIQEVEQNFEMLKNRNEDLHQKLNSMYINTPYIFPIVKQDHATIIKNLRNNINNSDIVIISSDKKEVFAHSAALKDLKIFSNATILKLNGKAPTNSEKLKLDLSTSEIFDEGTINYFLDLKYGIPTEPEKKLTQEQAIRLFYFANFIGDENIENVIIKDLFKDLNKDNLDVLLPGLFGIVLNLNASKHRQSFSQFMEMVKLAPNDLKTEWFETLKKFKVHNDLNIMFLLGCCYAKG